jgi:hypothetical protein
MDAQYSESRVLHGSGCRRHQLHGECFVDTIIYSLKIYLLITIFALKSVAATFERGRVLQALLLALERHFQFTVDNQVTIDVSFADRLFYLVSSRPGICAEAMDTFMDLWGMVTRVAALEFSCCVDASLRTRSALSRVDVIVTLANIERNVRVKMSIAMLQSICVCLSVWKDHVSHMSSELLANLNCLADALLISDVKNHDETGLCSARLLEDDSYAVTVESVSSILYRYVCASYIYFFLIFIV